MLWLTANRVKKPSLCFSWVIYQEKKYSGNLYVLSEGDYPNLTSMGCPPGFTIRSVKAVPVVRKHSYKNSALYSFLCLALNLHLSPSRHSQFLPSLCSASSVWRAERSPQTQRSSAWLKRASTTTFCPSESIAAGECLSLCACECLGKLFGSAQFVCLHLHKFICIDARYDAVKLSGSPHELQLLIFFYDSEVVQVQPHPSKNRVLCKT